MTDFELWHLKKGNIDSDFKATERTMWGTKLEAVIADVIADEQGWEVRKINEYMRDPSLRLGASFDFGGIPKGMELTSTNLVKQGFLFEIKNVDLFVYKNEWTESDDRHEAPLHIEFQVQQQLMISQKSHAFIGALVGGNRRILIKREPNLKVFEAIKKKAAAFWKSIEENVPPPVNYEKDAEVIGRIYNYAEPGKVIRLDEDPGIDPTIPTTNTRELAKEYRVLGEVVKAHEKRRDAIKAMLLEKFKNAEKIIGSDFTISAGMIAPTQISYERKGYRNFRINWRKAKDVDKQPNNNGRKANAPANAGESRGGTGRERTTNKKVHSNGDSSGPEKQGLTAS
jgi:predicted phage-related endonuclease